MIGMLIGHIARSACALPLAIVSGILAVCGLYTCMKCVCCKARDCTCCKRFLRVIGHDKFDDFELMVLVHEATFDRREDKRTTKVRITAGSHRVATQGVSNAIFQQPLHITVEQGTRRINLDLTDANQRVLATLTLDVMDHILGPKTLKPETVYPMVMKGSKGVRNPKLKLTMVVGSGTDTERGLMQNVSSDIDILVRQQLRKAKELTSSESGGLSEMEVLKQACAGPLEVFEGLGKTAQVYMAVVGPPTSRRWMLGVWQDKKSYESREHAPTEIDLLKIQGVQADPVRLNVFVINYYDESRVRQTISFRRIDRARDVWVEILHLLVEKAHQQKRDKRYEKSVSKGSCKTVRRGGHSERS